jgi:TRAP-type C4-dicarboxylate transport system permease small subunit
MGNVNGVVAKICRVFTLISMVALFIMMLLMICDVIGRTFFSSPIIGGYELVENLLLIVVVLAYAQAQISKRHIKVDIVTDMMPRKLKEYTELITLIICLAIVGFSSWQQIPAIQSVKAASTATMALKIPQWPLNVVVFIGLFMFSIVLIIDIVNQILKLSGKMSLTGDGSK